MVEKIQIKPIIIYMTIISILVDLNPTAFDIGSRFVWTGYACVSHGVGKRYSLKRRKKFRAKQILWFQNIKTGRLSNSKDSVSMFFGWWMKNIFCSMSFYIKSKRKPINCFTCSLKSTNVTLILGLRGQSI